MDDHTPGPWIAQKPAGWKRADIFADDECGTYIASINEENDSELANAILIAASPLLLAQHQADIADLCLLSLAIQAGDAKAELLIRVKDMERRKSAVIAAATTTKGIGHE